MVELTNVPPELRVNTGSPTTKTAEAKPSVKDAKDSRVSKSDYTPADDLYKTFNPMHT